MRANKRWRGREALSRVSAKSLRKRLHVPSAEMTRLRRNKRLRGPDALAVCASGGETLCAPRAAPQLQR